MSSGTTYHLLTESEPFSEYHGGAISRWAGNVLRRNPRAIVVCSLVHPGAAISVSSVACFVRSCVALAPAILCGSTIAQSLLSHLRRLYEVLAAVSFSICT